MSISEHYTTRIPVRQTGARRLRPPGRRPRRAAARRAPPPFNAPVAGHDLALVLFVGAACGLYYGLTCGWQIAVESAQAVAGIVSYPDDNPFYMYHIKAWTLLHQGPALLLKCGVSEQVVSMLLSCLTSVLSLQALALCSFAFSRDRLVACTVPAIYLATNVCKGCGAVYPISHIPNEYWMTYGVAGTAMTLLVWSLLGVGWFRTAALLCGLAPAVHPALGSWCVAVTVLALAWDWRRHRPRIRQIGPWFATGAVATAVSFSVQQYLSRGLPAADPLLARQILRAFVEGWDNHRVPFPLDSVDCQYGWCLAILAAAVIAWLPDKLGLGPRLLLRILLISALASLALCTLTHASQRLPMALMMAMPGRFINLAIVAYPAVLIGLLGRWRRAWSIGGLLACLSLFCLLRTLMLSKQLIYVPAAPKVFIACGLMLVYLLASNRPRTGSNWLRKYAGYGILCCLAVAAFHWRADWHLAAIVWLSVPMLWLLRDILATLAWPRLRPWLSTGTVVCFWLALFVKTGFGLAGGSLLAISSLAWWRDARFPSRGAGVGGGWDERRPSHHAFRKAINKLNRLRWAVSLTLSGACLSLLCGILTERAQAGYRSLCMVDPVLLAARTQKGLILAAPRLGLVQLRSRRPVVLNGEAMNQVTYVPASGPAMNRILNRIYDDDLLEPRPPWWRNWGGLMPYSGYQLWQERGTAGWRQLGREFGFTNVLTGSEWKLKLPVVAQSETMILYGVP